MQYFGKFCMCFVCKIKTDINRTSFLKNIFYFFLTFNLGQKKIPEL